MTEIKAKVSGLSESVRISVPLHPFETSMIPKTQNFTLITNFTIPAREHFFICSDLEGDSVSSSPGDYPGSKGIPTFVLISSYRMFAGAPPSPEKNPRTHTHLPAHSWGSSFLPDIRLEMRAAPAQRNNFPRAQQPTAPRPRWDKKYCQARRSPASGGT